MIFRKETGWYENEPPVSYLEWLRGEAAYYGRGEGWTTSHLKGWWRLFRELFPTTGRFDDGTRWVAILGVSVRGSDEASFWRLCFITFPNHEHGESWRVEWFIYD